MNDLIRRSDLLDLYEGVEEFKVPVEVIVQNIKDMPTAHDGWIPVGERLPADEEMVLVSCKTMKGIKSVNRAYYSNGSWHGSGSMSGVQAWMPLPEPYEAGEKE